MILILGQQEGRKGTGNFSLNGWTPRWEGRAGMNWEIGTDLVAGAGVKQIIRIYWIARGTSLRALWRPKWERNPNNTGYMSMYCQFTLIMHLRLWF